MPPLRRQILAFELSNLLLAGLIALPCLILYLTVDPYQRGFFCDDETIRHPYKSSTISNGVLYVIAFTIPFISIVVVETSIHMGWDPRREGKQVSCAPSLILMTNLFLGYLLGAAMSQCATDTTKYTIGRLRPHFIDVCQPDWASIACTDSAGHPLYVEDFKCLGNEELFPDPEEREKKMKDARLSFVSGHSSFSFQAIVWTILYLQARLVRGRVASRSFLLPFFQFGLFLIAFFTSLSRVSDYKHNPGDVLVGAILGAAVQLVNVLYIQKLFDRDSFRPPRSKAQGLLTPDEAQKHLNEAHQP